MRRPTFIATPSTSATSLRCLTALVALTILFPVAPLVAAPKPPPGRTLPPVPKRRDVPLSASLQSAARQELRDATAAADPIVRAHALEACRHIGGARADEQIIGALNDANAVVKLSALMAAGELKLRDAKEAAFNAINDNNPQIRVAAHFVLHRLGDTRFSHDLERTARDPDQWVRRQTVMVLGLLGEPSAVKILKPLQHDTDPGVRIQVAEALWRLGDEGGLESLIASSVSAYPDDQMIALPALAAPRDRRVIRHVVEALNSDYAEVALVAARAAGDLGADAGFGVALTGAASRDPRQRGLAALALGAIGRTDGQDALAKLLKDPDSPDVRLTAALALLQIGKANKG